ncbi:hypothetical protein HYZ05_02095 [Candidatus Daviesbacteria bacterium]|nr:hypothetical protein [Candidatus Daviesbacteria bacterium]
MIRFIVYSLSFIVVFLSTIFYLPSTIYAIVDPLSVPNNKFGIHIISATPDESSPAAQLVNNNGDWGYITFLIESKDRNENKWQAFFNDLRRRHLIPIVRLATKPVNEHWERPYEKEYEAWADFLDNLNWPIKNRYVIIYNEPNHGKEWGGQVDAKMYAKVLDQTITALKTKNRDFFVLNGGFDASAPNKPPLYLDQVEFMGQMEQAVPGIFNKLDGWVSHSYPNPAFAGSPDATGRGTVRTWLWELQLLRQFGVTKNLPIFITETGWQHAEGLAFNPNLPSSDTLSNYFQNAFQNAWNSSRIVAVTPFLLNYQEAPFDHFSFKKPAGEKQDYYPHYDRILNMPKVSGQPIQENKAQLIQGEIYSSLVTGETYPISLTFKNTGQSIWGDGDPVKLVPLQGGKNLGIQTVDLPKDIKVEPVGEYTFIINLKAPEKGSFNVKLNLFEGDTQFESNPVEFKTEVKLPVILQVLNSLKWKNSAEGQYLLRVSGVIGESSQKVTLNPAGQSAEIEARFLLPDYSFDFTLEKPYYHPKTIHQTVKPGVNILDFGTLEPKLFSALLNPKELWKLLPFSN